MKRCVPFSVEVKDNTGKQIFNEVSNITSHLLFTYS